MTETTQAATPEVTQGEMIEIFRGREWARIVVGQIDTVKLHSFHACHALLAETFSKMLAIDIESARTAVNGFLSTLLEGAKAKHAAAEPSKQLREASNIVSFPKEEQS